MVGREKKKGPETLLCLFGDYLDVVTKNDSPMFLLVVIFCRPNAEMLSLNSGLHQNVKDLKPLNTYTHEFDLSLTRRRTSEL